MNFTRVTLATASSVLVLAALAACGGDSTDTASDTNRETDGQSGQPAGGQGGPRPGAFGEVAAVSGSTVQVQNPTSGQVAVSWTDDTTFTQQVGATLADVTVGSCVVVTSADDEAAAAVQVTDASDDGGCGFGAGGGPRPEGAPSGPPSGLPSDLPSDPPEGGGRGLATIGEVIAVSATGFTVSATRPGADDASEVSVAVGDDTAYTTTAKATATAVEVGVCVSAQGDSDDTGAVTATSISVSQPVDGACTGGFGRGGMGGGPRGEAS